MPEIRWMINTGNTRRENTQAYLIPLLREAGFNVVASNGTAEEVFQQRLPGLDYDLAMYISTAPPDPQYLTPSFICSQIPTEENNFQGQNTQGWCNEEASALLEEADRTTDEEARIELVHDAIRLMETDSVLLPLANYPKVGIWRTDAWADRSTVSSPTTRRGSTSTSGRTSTATARSSSAPSSGPAASTR